MKGRDPYDHLGQLYLALIPPDGSTRMGDPHMHAWLSANARNGWRILDAGCGIGTDIVAMRSGALGCEITPFGSDASSAMLGAAMSRGRSAGLSPDHYRLATYATLASAAPDWKGSFEAVIACYGLYAVPGDLLIEDTDAYLVDCLNGLGEMMAPGGVLLVNNRDWKAFLEQNQTTLLQSNVHEGTCYTCRYEWTFDRRYHERHSAEMTLKDEATGESRTTVIAFADRGDDAMRRLFKRADLEVIHHVYDPDIQGSAFHTYTVSKKYR